MFESRYIYHTRTTGETRVWRRPWGRKRGILIIILKKSKEIIILLSEFEHFESGCSREWQFSFQMWTGEMQENMDCKKHGDTAFRAKDFETAIEFYTEVNTNSPYKL